jgi:uncharacterized small protein (DUF1192 family)
MIRPQRVQAAFEVFEGKDDTGPNASAMFEYIEELEARITSLTAEVERLQNEVESHIQAELIREASLTAANELLAEAEKVIGDMASAIGDWSRPTGANGMVAAREDHPLCIVATAARALSQRLAGRVK